MVEDKKKPTKTYRASLLNLSVWENENEEGVIHSFSFQKSYKDLDGEWKHTQSLGVSDLPKLRLLIEKAYSDYYFSEE